MTPGVRVTQLTLQPFVTKLLPRSWYVQTQPTITLHFVKGTSSVPVNLVVGKLFAGRWNVNSAADGVSTVDVSTRQGL